jgi:hypothetical protein
MLGGKCRKYYEEGLKLLDILAQMSPLSLKGAKIMRQLQLRILQEGKIDMSRTLSATLPDSPQIIHGVAQQLLSFSPPGFQECLASAETPSAKLGQDFMTVGWESFSTGADISWSFYCTMFQNARIGDPGMDSGMEFGNVGVGTTGHGGWGKKRKLGETPVRQHEQITKCGIQPRNLYL